MRVRYGKPIKVKSMLSTSASRDISNGGSYALVYRNWGTGYDDKEFRAFTEADYTHKFFCYTEYELGTNRFDYTSFAAQGTSNSTYKANNYSLCSVNTPNADSVSLYVYGALESSITVKTRFMLDLTEIFGNGKEPTAEQFYNKYNKYFPLIATGEEITIDDKSGQVSLGPRLPSEYQEVEYIESTGTQYIDSGFNAQNGFKIKMNFRLTQSSSSIYRNTLFGLNANDRECFFRINSSTTYSFWANTQGSSGFTYDTFNNNQNYSIECVFDVSSYLKINGVEVRRLTTTKSFGNDTIPLLAEKNILNLNVLNYSKCRLFSCQIYELNNTLVRDFVPCYRESDNEIGLYDLVNGVFYTNQGTGTFLKGNDVNNIISCKVAGGSSDIYYGYNQLISFNGFTNSSKTINDVTLTNNGDGSYTLNGTASARAEFVGTYPSYVSGHYYDLVGNDSLPNGCQLHDYSYRFDKSHPIRDCIGGQVGTEIDVTAGTVLDNVIVYPQLIDLTDWYGEGKEPTTVAEFKEKFTKEYYGTCLTPIKLTRYQIEALPSYGYNQLINSTFEFNITLSSDDTTSANWWKYPTYTWKLPSNDYMIQGHKYLGLKYSNLPDDIIVVRNAGHAENMTGFFTWGTTSSTITVGIFKLNNHTISAGDYYIGYNCIDLTDWYGEGNEPTTIEEFKATFPNKYYPYSKKRLLNKYMINKLKN